ncbi:MAG TPA: FAD-binding oxidoreductase [Sphingomonas sp.]|nr:FAD-binding oxidoreductase [Sphingomonas sp.]
MRSIVVLGGGIIGLTSALALARHGLAVTVLGPDTDHAAASWGNAGHLAVEQIVPLASPQAVRSAPGRLFVRGGALALPLRMIGDWAPFVARLLRASTPAKAKAGTVALGGLMAEAMPAWRRLADALDTPELLRENGHLIVWESARSAERGRRAWEEAETGAAHLVDADDADRRALAAAVDGPIGGVARFSGSGQIADLDRLRNALHAALAAAGVAVVKQAGRLTVERGKAVVPGIPADAVLVAAGVGSKPLMRAAGHRAPLIAERGYHLRGAANRWPERLPPVVFEDRAMIVTRYADCVQAASFVELGNPDAPPDPRKWARLERHIADLGLAFGPPYRRWMGSRPTLPDYLPAIGRSTRADNLLYAFGHQHLGLTLAAVTAELVASIATDASPAIDLTPFAIDRFA